MREKTAIQKTVDSRPKNLEAITRKRFLDILESIKFLCEISRGVDALLFCYHSTTSFSVPSFHLFPPLCLIPPLLASSVLVWPWFLFVAWESWGILDSKVVKYRGKSTSYYHSSSKLFPLYSGCGSYLPKFNVYFLIDMFLHCFEHIRLCVDTEPVIAFLLRIRLQI